ncbi:MAG: tRNA pseudouridine(55) synthase TruB [Bacteroidales bacterium]|nr:tRNA pseudouridine(55) synthase TruB [Bacteroidales bacterium]
MDYLDGEILYFNKPFTWTSFKLVAKVRNSICKKLNIKKLKVGHAGTLDPLATGVMIICTGKATKRIEEFQYQTKEYIATLELGATTTSYDLEKPIDQRFDYSHVTCESVEKVIKKFVGRIEQIPPDFSACKINGRRAYNMARNGEEVNLKPKVLVIDEIELLECQIPMLKIRVVCSKGTYIRALARDLGEALNCGAHLTALCRTRVGDIRLEDCQNVDDFLLNLKSEDTE